MNPHSFLIDFSANSSPNGNTPIVTINKQSTPFEKRNSIIEFIGSFNDKFSSEQNELLLELLIDSTKAFSEKIAQEQKTKYTKMISTATPQQILQYYKTNMTSVEMSESKKLAMNINIPVNSLFTLNPKPKRFDPSSTVNGLRELFSKLQNEVAHDPSVSSFVPAILNKAQEFIASGIKPVNPGPKIKKGMELIKSGIPPNAKASTKKAYTDLENEFIRIRNLIAANGLPGDNNFKFDKNNITLLLGENVTQGSNGRIRPPLRNTIISRFMTNIGNIIKRSRIGDLMALTFRGTFNGNRMITSNVPTNINPRIRTSNINEETEMSGTKSNIEITTSLNENELMVKFTGIINSTTIGGIYSINTYSLSYISQSIYFNLLKLPENKKKLYANNSGVKDTTDQDMWNSYLIFLLSYLSLMCYCMTNKTNTLGIEAPAPKYKNLMFILTNEAIQNNPIPESSTLMKSNTKQILSLSYSRLWQSLFPI